MSFKLILLSVYTLSNLTNAKSPIMVIKIPNNPIPEGKLACKNRISPPKAKNTSPDCVASTMTSFEALSALLLAYKNNEVAITPENSAMIATFII